VQIIDGDANPERRRKAVLSAPAKTPSGIANIASAKPATRVWNGSDNPRPADQRFGVGAQPVAFPERKRGTDQVAECVGTTSSARDVWSKRVTEIQFSSNAPATINSKANVHSVQSNAA
jgi:hypothetical protein